MPGLLDLGFSRPHSSSNQMIVKATVQCQDSHCEICSNEASFSQSTLMLRCQLSVH